jgi:sterol desaturase/sphingolipid hydroxylase (fatty acid hydroxylase superfamily)
VAQSTGSWPKPPWRLRGASLGFTGSLQKGNAVPTLVQLFTDPISLAFFALFGGVWGVEALFPARRLPPIPGHRLRGVAALLVYFLISSYLPLVVGPWLAPFKVAELTFLGTWGGGLAAFLVYQLVAYAYHRSLHRFDGLFRAVHQMHHSAERLDVASAFLFGPLDMIGWTLVSTIALSIAGITPGATVVFLLAGAFVSTFQHANLRTPRWLGYLIQRPESHSYHHARGVHAQNYADLPLIDLLFGTFVNPREFADHTGYYDGASARVREMLLFCDVSTPREDVSTPRESAAVLSQGRLAALAERATQRTEAPPVLSGR